MITKLEPRYNEVWLIWPEDAKKLLSQNYKGNRKISPSVVRKYANDMANGKWGDVPDPLIITKNGTLLNGQHRLTAMISAGIPLTFEVRIVPDTDIFKYLDNGKSRTVNDYVELRYKPLSSSIASFAYCATNGNSNIRASFNGVLRQSKGDGGSFSVRADRVGIAEYANTHKDGIENVAGLAKKMYEANKYPSAKTIGAALWLISRFDDIDLTEEFADEYCKIAPDSKSVYAGKAAIIKAYSGNSKPDVEWSIGMLLDIYKKFVDCTGAVRFNGWRATYLDYEQKMFEARAKNT